MNDLLTRFLDNLPEGWERVGDPDDPALISIPYKDDKKRDRRRSLFLNLDCDFASAGFRNELEDVIAGCGLAWTCESFTDPGFEGGYDYCYSLARYRGGETGEARRVLGEEVANALGNTRTEALVKCWIALKEAS